MNAAHSRQLSWFPLAGDSLFARPFEADQVLLSHFDTPHFIFFPAAKELGIWAKVSSLDNGQACVIKPAIQQQETHPSL